MEPAAAPGQIDYAGCLGSTAEQECFDLPFAPFDGAEAVAVSPDGRSVYVASYASDSISHLFRDTAGGQLALYGCLNNDGSDNCGDLPLAPLDNARAVAVSPDGRSVYVASTSSGGGTIAHREVPGAPLGRATGLAVSADGTSVYAVAYDSDSIAHLFRNTGNGHSPGMAA